MKYVKWGFWIFLILLVGGFLHYTLPRHDIVRIVGTETKRVNVGMNRIFYDGRMRDDQGRLIGTDVFFINTVRPNGNTRVFRNEDTNWWPPYLKFDSSDLHARATDLVSTAAQPQWIAVRFYGWRSQILTIYPNAVRVWPVESPDVRIIPWFNIGFFITVVFVGLALRRRWNRWIEARREARG